MKSRVLMAMFACALLCGAATAQLSGTYTIDNSAATGGLNYASFVDAAADLTLLGVSGPTTFLVAPGTGTYAGFALGAVTGQGPTNPISFQAVAGPRPVISGAAATFVHGIRLGTGTSIAAGVGTGPSNILIEGLEVVMAPSGAGIFALGCNFITIRNCFVRDCGSGIGLAGDSADCVVEDCEVFNCVGVAGTPASNTYCGGIFDYYRTSRNTIQRNRVHDCTSNGIFVGSSGSTTAVMDALVINNLIWNCGTQTSVTYAGGIGLRRATNSIVANNSILMPAGANKPGINIMGGSSTTPLIPQEVSNNLIQVNDATQACIGVDYAIAVPAIFNYNAYDAAAAGPIGGVGTSITTWVTSPDLPSWQTATMAEANSAVGGASFLSATDLRITPGSVAFNAGSTVAAVTVDAFLTPRPVAGLPDAGAHETSATGLFAGFAVLNPTGPAAHSANFMDTSFSSDPGGVTTWAWDIDNDGTDDYFTPNVTHVYTCPGSYDVKLTVTDAANPTSVTTMMGAVTVGDYSLSLSTTMGVGDLTLTPVPAACYPTATQGFTLVSLTATGPMGAGTFFGISFDFLTLTGLTTVPTPGNPLSFITTGTTYPDAGPVTFPAGFFAPLIGANLDAVEVLIDPSWNIVYVSNVARVTF